MKRADTDGRGGGDSRLGGDGALAAVNRRLLAMPAGARVLLGVGLLALMAVLDDATGSELSVSIFYLAPVTFAGALISRRAGVVFAFLSAASWGYLEITTGSPYSEAWTPYWNSAVRLAFFLLVNELVERLRRAHARERALSRTDSLTGIANARVFGERAEWAIAMSRRSGRPFTLAYLDLDRFKQVNDEHGHSEGDRLLRRVAALITANVRTSDLVARLSGDEFAVLMPDTEEDRARALLDRVSAAITAEVAGRWSAGVTVGAVTFTEPPADFDCALREADALMYVGKAKGRGRIVQAPWPAAARVC